MYNPNYGYSPAASHQHPSSLPFSSTPSHVRPSRPPRFGYPGPASYPRPRSSASKPNPEGYSESTRVPYANPEDYYDNMRNNYPITHQDGYPNSESYIGSPIRNNYTNACHEYMNSSMQSIYESASDNCMNTPPNSSFGNTDDYIDNMRGTSDSMVNNYDITSNRNTDSSFFSMKNSSTLSQNSTAYFTCNDSLYESPQKSLFLGNSPASPFQYSASNIPLKGSGYNAINKPNFQRRFQNKKDKFKAHSALVLKPKVVHIGRSGPGKKSMATKTKWECTICSVELTSSKNCDKHLRGAKHAKKLKLQDALASIQLQVAQNKEIAQDGKTFRCELCNIFANSSIQLQTHLSGAKHQNKLLRQQKLKERKTEKGSEAKAEPEPEPEPEVNGKSNGAAVVRPLPEEFGEPQQAKMCKFSCDICGIILNSEVQLQQHLTSKKHQAKAEGKPYPKKKFKRKMDDDENEEKIETEQKTDDNTMETQQQIEGDATKCSNATETASDKSEACGTSEPKTETSDAGEARKMVVGVKTLSASFVQGDTLQ